MLHVLGKMGDEPTGKTWKCQRTTAGVKCGHQNTSRLRKCAKCGKPRPARKRPAHMAALDIPYETYAMLNGGEHCGICGKPPKPGRRLARDHDHRGAGKPRGLLCFQCNRLLGNKTRAFLSAALDYLDRAEERELAPSVAKRRGRAA